LKEQIRAWRLVVSALAWVLTLGGA